MVSELRYAALWQTLGGIWVTGVVVLSLMPAPPSPPSFLVWDKAQHALAYAFLGWWCVQAWGRGRWLSVGGALLGLGVLLEVLQGLGGERHFEWADMLANGVGVALGAAAVWTPVGRVFDRLEAAVAPAR